jgi:hypothetical protein
MKAPRVRVSLCIALIFALAVFLAVYYLFRSGMAFRNVAIFSTINGDSRTFYELTPRQLSGLKQKVEHGDSEAAIRIAFYYWQFVGDQKEALVWLERSKNLGNKRAAGMYDNWRTSATNDHPSFNGNVAAETSRGVKLDKLRRIADANPAMDAQRAIAVKDLRFVEVMGYTYDAPGVDAAHRPLIKKYGFRVIDGTSDCPATDEEEQLNQRAWNYAEAYNKLLVQHLDRASDR